MIFDGLSTSATFGLFAAAAAAALVLHFLRTRPHELSVVTSVFWREALAVTQPRRLLYRFRYLLTFILIVAIAALICLALSERMQRIAASRRQHVVMIVDAGLSMQATASPDGTKCIGEAMRTSREFLTHLSNADRVAVIVVDPLPRVIHRFDQPLVAALRRIQDIEPADQPAQRSEALSLARRILARRANPRIVHVTHAGQRRINAPPGEIVAEVLPVGERTRNAAILSAVFVADESQPWLGRVHVKVGAWGKESNSCQLRIRRVVDDQILLNESVSISPSGTVDFVSAVTSADGTAVDIALTESPGAEADNRLALTLPTRGVLTVGASAELPSALELALDVLGCKINESESEAELVVTSRLDANPDAGRPQIILASDGPHLNATSELSANPELTFLIGLNLEDCSIGPGGSVGLPAESAEFTPVLLSGKSVVAALESTATDSPRLVLSRALFGPGATFTSDPAFVIFVARMLEQLNLRDANGWTVPVQRTLLDPVWVSRERASRTLSEVAGDRLASNLAESPQPDTAPVFDSNSAWQRDRLLLLAALLLIVVEGALHARGRIV